MQGKKTKRKTEPGSGQHQSVTSCRSERARGPGSGVRQVSRQSDKIQGGQKKKDLETETIQNYKMYRQKFGDFWKDQDVSSQINKESLKFYFKMPKI